MNTYIILMELLKTLNERQSWCPLCGAEYGHQARAYDFSECLLKEYWDHGIKK